MSRSLENGQSEFRPLALYQYKFQDGPNIYTKGRKGGITEQVHRLQSSNSILH